MRFRADSEGLRGAKDWRPHHMGLSKMPSQSEGQRGWGASPHLVISAPSLFQAFADQKCFLVRLPSQKVLQHFRRILQKYHSGLFISIRVQFTYWSQYTATVAIEKKKQTKSKTGRLVDTRASLSTYHATTCVDSTRHARTFHNTASPSGPRTGDDDGNAVETIIKN